MNKVNNLECNLKVNGLDETIEKFNQLKSDLL